MLLKSCLLGLLQPKGAAAALFDVARHPPQQTLGSLWALINCKPREYGIQQAFNVLSASQLAGGVSIDCLIETPSSRRRRFMTGAGVFINAPVALVKQSETSNYALEIRDAGNLHNTTGQRCYRELIQGRRRESPLQGQIKRMATVAGKDCLVVHKDKKGKSDVRRSQAQRRQDHLRILQLRADEIRKEGDLSFSDAVPPPSVRETWTGALKPGGEVQTYNIGNWRKHELQKRRNGKCTPEQTMEMAAAAGMDAAVVQKDEWWKTKDERTDAERRRDNLRILQLRADEIRKADGMGPGDPVPPPKLRETWTGTLEPGGEKQTHNIGFWWHKEIYQRRSGKLSPQQMEEMARAAGVDTVDQRNQAQRRQDHLRVLQLRADEIRKAHGLGPNAPVPPPKCREIWTGSLKLGRDVQTHKIGFWWHWELAQGRKSKRTSDQMREMATAIGMDAEVVEKDEWWIVKKRNICAPRQDYLCALQLRADEIRKKGGLDHNEAVPPPLFRETWTGALTTGTAQILLNIGWWFHRELDQRRRGKRTPEQTMEMARAVGIAEAVIEKDEWWKPYGSYYS